MTVSHVYELTNVKKEWEESLLRHYKTRDAHDCLENAWLLRAVRLRENAARTKVRLPT